MPEEIVQQALTDPTPNTTLVFLIACGTSLGLAGFALFAVSFRALLHRIGKGNGFATDDRRALTEAVVCLRDIASTLKDLVPTVKLLNNDSWLDQFRPKGK